MKRGIWIGTAVLVAAVAAVPLWLSLDGGSRNQAALAETTETEARRSNHLAEDAPGVIGEHRPHRAVPGQSDQRRAGGSPTRP